MTPPRVVLVTRRFWPLFGGPEVMMARLAAGFERSGVRTTVVTAKWQKDWPDEFEHHGARVVRLEPPGTRWWSAAAYIARLRRWLLANRESFDLAYVSGLRHDAYATLLAAGRAGFPVVLRAEQAGLAGDCRWQLEARFGRTIKRSCRRAAAIVASTPLVEREVIAAGYRRERIRSIPLGVPDVACPEPDARLEARRALAASQRRLAVPAVAPLAVFAGRFVVGKGLLDLIEAWPAVLQRVPEAHLWLVGEGPQAVHLAAEIERRGLTTRVTLAGAFEDVEDCLCAADLFVVASHDDDGVLALLEAMSLGLPSVVTDTAAHRAVIENGQHGRLVPIGQPRVLAAAIADLCCQSNEAARLGRAARQRVQNEFSFDRCLDRHLTLLTEVHARSAQTHAAPVP
ncbi:MAG TPA: glycosyltransferase family 4 protein [Pirellulales bacterium]|nr:glycosyltransferase family 4 protein [Pirellulales bacterium]